MSGTGGLVESFLTLKWREVVNSEGLAVCATENGGFAIEEYIRRQDYISEDNFWFINPLKFLIRTFKLKNLPVPEPSRIGNSRLVSFAIETGGKRGNSLFAAFLQKCEALAVPLSPIKSIPDIDEDIDMNNGVFSLILNKKNMSMAELRKSPVLSIENLAEGVFCGKLTSDYRVHIYFDENIFDNKETADQCEEFLTAIVDSDFYPVASDVEAKIAADAHNLKHGLVSSGGYYLTDNGALREVRSIAGDGYPDLARCSNIFGYKKAGGRLLLHLGNEKETRLNLAAKEQPQVYLSSFTRYVSDFQFDSFRWIIKVDGCSRGKILVSGLKAGEKYVCEFFADNEQRLLEETSFSADLSGRATIKLTGKGLRRIEFWSDKDNSYWFVKIRRFFWATGTFPLFIIFVVFLFFFIIWKVTRLIV